MQGKLSRAHMRMITGRICGLLTDSAGEINGIVLESGRRIGFPVEKASEVLCIVTMGSEVEVQAAVQDGAVERTHVDARVITDLGSKRSVTLCASRPSYMPEVAADNCPPPGMAAPLAPTSEPALGGPKTPGIGAAASDSEAATQIARAYDGLHRTQVMLAYIKSVQREGATIGQYFAEAKHTYEQAISCYQERDFEGAHEFAAPSCGLSCAGEILISGTFQLTIQSCDHKALTLPPAHIPANRVRVQKLTLWSASLQRWARRLLETGAIEEAIEFAHAANAAAGSAEHLCKQCYVTHRAHSQVTAAAR